jgi:hypothetical protein
MSHQCARPNCYIIANSSCSSCNKDYYCSVDCQKMDWKVHKLICPILQKLSDKLQPIGPASKFINEILTSNKGNDK